MKNRSLISLALCTCLVLFFSSFVVDHLHGSTASSETPLDSVPEWAKRAMWYQIFPERFRNGDPTNDPEPKDLVGAWPHESARNWRVSEWTGDWYKLQPWEKEDNKGFYFHCQQRRYGGDLQGVIDKLDYLAELGITAIYFNPLFESPSLHKYDATLYHHIDNNFGPDPDGDRAVWSSENPADPATWRWTSADRLFLRLLEQAHKRGIKVIIDGVFNHVGLTFWAFEDTKRNQQNSPYKDWFTITRWDDPKTKEDEFAYQGWADVRELPEIREDSNGLVGGPREHVHAVVRRWMDPNGDGDPSDGIDGWRLDVAEKVDRSFWREFRRWVRGINPDAYIVGEVWWEDWQNEVMYDPAPWLQGDVFDAVMNYRWAREAFRFFGGKKKTISASEFAASLEGFLKGCRSENSFALMNLYDSHDTDRIGSHLVNADLPYDKNVGLNGNRDYDIRKPNAEEIRVEKLMAVFQMTAVGAPTVYYGTEVGMWGADDPDCRKPMLWSDLKFQPERSHPFLSQRKADENVPDADLFKFYKNVIDLRKRHEALATGSFTPILADDERGILAFRRGEAGEQFVVVLNNEWARQRVTIPISHQQGGELTDLLSQRKYPVKEGTVTMTIEAKSGVVLR